MLLRVYTKKGGTLPTFGSPASAQNNILPFVIYGGGAITISSGFSDTPLPMNMSTATNSILIYSSNDSLNLPMNMSTATNSVLIYSSNESLNLPFSIVP